MLQSLIKGNELVNVSLQAPSPSKDFVNLTVTLDQVIWRYWKINPACLKSDVQVGPTEMKESHDDFTHDLDLQSEVKRIFGNHMLQYVLLLCKGQFDFFSRISDTLKIYIISFMDLENVANLAKTNKHFHELCTSEQLWEHIVERHCDTVTPEMRLYAGEVGWKNVFFTNKLQLQAQIRRHQQRVLFNE